MTRKMIISDKQVILKHIHRWIADGWIADGWIADGWIADGCHPHIHGVSPQMTV